MSKPANPMAKKLPPKSKPPIFKPEDYVRSNLPIAQIQQLKQAFDLFDVTQQGKIDPKQLKNALIANNIEAKNGTFYNAIASIQKQGPIDFMKFLEVMSARTGLQRTRQNLKKMFAIFDQEKSGFISVKNLKKIVKDVGLSSINDKEIGEMIDKADLDNDGLVSEEEFFMIMTKRSKKL